MFDGDDARNCGRRTPVSAIEPEFRYHRARFLPTLLAPRPGDGEGGSEVVAPPGQDCLSGLHGGSMTRAESAKWRVHDFANASESRGIQ